MSKKKTTKTSWYVLESSLVFVLYSLSWLYSLFFLLLNHIGKRIMKSREELNSEKKLELEKRLLDVNNQLNSRKRQTKRRYLFFFFLIYLLIYFWLCWFLVAVHGLSLVAANWSYSSSCGAWGSQLRWLLLLWSTGSRHTGFSSCSSLALELRLSTQLWYTDLVTPQRVEFSGTRDQTCVSCIGR